MLVSSLWHCTPCGRTGLPMLVFHLGGKYKRPLLSALRLAHCLYACSIMVSQSMGLLYQYWRWHFLQLLHCAMTISEFTFPYSGHSRIVTLQSVGYLLTFSCEIISSSSSKMGCTSFRLVPYSRVLFFLSFFYLLFIDLCFSIGQNLFIH